MPNIKPLNDALSLQTYAEQSRVKFRLVPESAPLQSGTPEVEVPVAIVYRLHHLGRAYDGQAVKLLLPQGSFQIGFVQLQRLISELDLVAQVVTADPVSQHYLAQLLPLLRQSSSHPSHVLKVISP